MVSSLTFTLILAFLIPSRFLSSPSIAHLIRANYDTPTLTTYRALEKTNKKLTKLKHDLIFLNLCNSQGITPKFLKFKLYRQSLQDSSMYKTWQKTLLRKEIRLKEQESQQLKIKRTQLLNTLKNELSFFHFLGLQWLSSKTSKKLDTQISSNHNKKLRALGASLHINNCDHSKVIFNLSDRILSSRENFLLSFGLHFGIPSPTKFINHFARFEYLATRLKQELTSIDKSFTDTCSAIRHAATTLFRKTKHPTNNFLFKKHDTELLKRLQSDDSLHITRPDKGRGVVILNKSDYLNKMTTILSDTSKFTLLPSSTDQHQLTMKLEDAVNRFARKLLDNKTISPQQYDYIRTSSSNLGIMYGLPKIHKPETPLRPILSAINTHSYNIAKFLVPLLEPLTRNQYTVKNSYSFSALLNSLSYQEPVHMASFDITSLFTNIPVDETIEIICNTIFENSDTFNGFNLVNFKKLLEIACKDSHFIFNNRIYKQTEGGAMGSPVSPTLANIFLCHHEENWLRDCPPEFKPVQYHRYVDDTFTCFSRPHHPEQFLSYLNSKHPNINFTLEYPTGNSLPFLDCNVSFSNGTFSTSVYRKATFTGLGTNFNSYVHSGFKLNAIRTLIHRAYHLSSSYILFDAEIKFLRNFFSNNGFPQYLVDNTIHKFLKNIFCPKQPLSTAGKKPLYIALPYCGQDGEEVYNKLHSQLSSIYPYIKFQFIQKTSRSIASYFPTKDLLQPLLRSGVIYKYACGSCNALYLGVTRRRAIERFHEHLGTSHRTKRTLLNPPFSHIRNHGYDNNHPISIHNFSVVQPCPPHLLNITESLYIATMKPAINAQLTSTPLYITDGTALQSASQQPR